MKPFQTELPRLIFAATLMGGMPIHSAALAQSGDFSGRAELTYRAASSPADSVAAAFATASYQDVLGNLRLRWHHRWGAVSAELHYVLTARSGPGAGNDAALAALAPAAPPGNLFTLSQNITSTTNQRISHRIDRLSLTYSTPTFVMRIGRQALTWGAGTAFHPMDLVNPFSPAQRDTEFKPGTDMLYLQWLFESGADLEAIAVPRRAVAGGPISGNASTYALRYRTSFGDLGVEAIMARDHGDTTAGLGLSGALGGAAWNLELVPTRLSNGTTRTSGLANISTATMLFDRPALVFAEYFHNGFGMAGSPVSAATLPPSLRDRLLRGQVFTTSRNYLALGARLEISPLWNISGSSIFNLDDGSHLAVAELNWSLSDNSNLILGAQIPAGARGSEFGGLSLSGIGAPYLTPEKSIYLQYRQYF